mmetsp:Transcript_62330/g.140454  ORF Transcript_62330/g.140454 Transcript_62330/m.140454 type:complete len:298 (-) Transcript_62330:692-1585(-)
MGVLIAADLRSGPKVRQAAGAGEVETLLGQGLGLLLERRCVPGRLIVVAPDPPLLALARSDALALRDLLLVERRAAEALVLQGVHLLQRRLHDVAELRGRGHGNVLALLASLCEDRRLLPLLLLLLLGVTEALDALRDRREGGLALLRRPRVGPPHQASLLGELLVKLRVLLVRARIHRPARWHGARVAYLVVPVLALRGLAPLRLLLGWLPELGHLLRCVVVGLHLELCLEGVLLAECSQDGQPLLRVPLLDGTEGTAADEEARWSGLELVVLLENVLPILAGVILHLLLERIVVL